MGGRWGGWWGGTWGVGGDLAVIWWKFGSILVGIWCKFAGYISHIARGNNPKTLSIVTIPTNSRATVHLKLDFKRKQDN